MKIKYLGHSSFCLTADNGASVVTDPYDHSIGYVMPSVKADVVTVSHHHYDHDAVSEVKGNPEIIDKEGSYNFKGIKISSVKSFHDPVRGALRGENIIFKFKIDGINICHLGDLGEVCCSSLIDSILPVDILLIPVGGNYTIDAKQAKQYISCLNPHIVIPMHYHRDNAKIDIEGVGNFTSLFGGNIVYYEDSEAVFRQNDMEGNTVKILVMEKAV